MSNRIVLNAVKCCNCNQVVVSAHRHDFRECECGNIFTDGGHDYTRRGGKLDHAYEDFSLVEKDGKFYRPQDIKD